jgi:hypothetical protein
MCRARDRGRMEGAKEINANLGALNGPLRVSAPTSACARQVHTSDRIVLQYYPVTTRRSNGAQLALLVGELPAATLGAASATACKSGPT